MKAEDISEKEFGTSLRGLNQEEVYRFLELVAQEWSKMENEIERLRKEEIRASDRLHAQEEKEHALGQTLAAAEKTRSQTQDMARREADLIKNEARLEADLILRHAEAQRQTVLEEIRLLEAFYARLRSRLRVVLDTFNELLKSPSELIEEIQMAKAPGSEPTGPYVGGTGT